MPLLPYLIYPTPWHSPSGYDASSFTPFIDSCDFTTPTPPNPTYPCLLPLCHGFPWMQTWVYRPPSPSPSLHYRTPIRSYYSNTYHTPPTPAIPRHAPCSSTHGFCLFPCVPWFFPIPSFLWFSPCPFPLLTQFYFAFVPSSSLPHLVVCLPC